MEKKDKIIMLLLAIILACIIVPMLLSIASVSYLCIGMAILTFGALYFLDNESDE